MLQASPSPPEPLDSERHVSLAQQGFSQVPPPPLHISAAAEPTPDFTRRVFALRELLDEPCTYAVYTDAMRDLARINRLTHAYRPTLAFVAAILKTTGVRHTPLHVVDLGCGHGDTLRTLHRWAAKRSVPLKLTGIDLNPYAARLARECDRHEHVSAGTIRWLTADALTLPVLEAPPDIIVSNLTAHHLPDAAIPQLLHTCAQARLGFQITDLRRSQRAAQVFSVLARLFAWHPLVRHDGIVSFQRAFSLAEWRALLAETNPAATLTDLGFGRLSIQQTHR